MNVSVSIMAHPKRAKFIPYLKEHLGDVPVGWDAGRGDIWDTRKIALRLHDPSARFHLVVQDDAIIGKDFYPRLERVLEQGEGYTYSLYFRFKSRVTHADLNAAAKAGWDQGGFAFPRLQFGIGVVMPVAIIPDLIQRCDTFTKFDQRVGQKRRGGSDDLRMSRYLDEIGMLTYYPLPSLIDHRPDAVSLAWHGPNRDRMAAWFE